MFLHPVAVFKHADFLKSGCNFSFDLDGDWFEHINIRDALLDNSNHGFVMISRMLVHDNYSDYVSSLKEAIGSDLDRQLCEGTDSGKESFVFVDSNEQFIVIIMPSGDGRSCLRFNVRISKVSDAVQMFFNLVRDVMEQTDSIIIAHVIKVLFGPSLTVGEIDVIVSIVEGIVAENYSEELGSWKTRLLEGSLAQVVQPNNDLNHELGSLMNVGLLLSDTSDQVEEVDSSFVGSFDHHSIQAAVIGDASSDARIQALASLFDSEPSVDQKAIAVDSEPIDLSLMLDFEML